MMDYFCGVVCQSSVPELGAQITQPGASLQNTIFRRCQEIFSEILVELNSSLNLVVLMYLNRLPKGFSQAALMPFQREQTLEQKLVSGGCCLVWLVIFKKISFYKRQ